MQPINALSIRLLLVASFTPVLVSCMATGIQTGTEEFDESLGIEAVPTSLKLLGANSFDRYTKVSTPNGGVIHIIAQSLVTNEQMVRCRGILEHFLRDLPGSRFGENKSEVANRMSDNGAILSLLNGSDDGRNPTEPLGQALYQHEIQVEGHDWYINQDYDHRDAAYEEILHLVHDFGIGVDGHNSHPGALPEFQQAIRNAQQDALSQELWGMGADDWIAELDEENSLTQEYLAALIDSYYGLWGAFDESPTHGMWGIYVAKTRDEILLEDPMGHELLSNQFFHPYLTYNARIDADFSGTFSLKFDESISYSHHSRYLKDVTLLGTNDTNIRVNELDNNLTGNAGQNGAIFSGVQSEYEITTEQGVTTVIDSVAERDGTNTLVDFESLEFSDGNLSLE